MPTLTPTVLITRPDGQAATLLNQLRAAGHAALQRPALLIEPLPMSDADRRLLMDLDQFHAVFFVSANAARLALEAMADLWPQWPVGVHWLAVGRATAEVIAAAGLTPETPASGFNSEAMLNLPCLTDVGDRRVLICRGETGRDWLAARLRERGAEVTLMPFYRRLPNRDFQWPPEADVVMITSVEGWRVVARQVPGGATVIAAGARVAGVVAGDHRGKLVTADSAHDADMIAALSRCC